MADTEFMTEKPALFHGRMEINGISFPIDPQGISVYEENFNHAFQTIRTRESTKVRSGHSRIGITVKAIFTGISAGRDAGNDGSNSLATINETLMPILYSLKKMPLCFIDNELIRRNLPVSSVEGEEGWTVGENIGAFIRSVNIGTVPGFPHAVSAEFQFVWYNHRPFCPRLIFRKEWVDDAGKLAELREQYAQHTLQGEDQGPTQQTWDDHTGRTAFIQNYGHPSIAFNATAYHTFTESIHEARPLLEYLWPYKYQSSNPAGSGSQQVFEINKLPPFELQSFDQDFSFGFTVMRQPEKSLLNLILNRPELRRAIEEARDGELGSPNRGPRRRRDRKAKYATADQGGRTGALSRTEVAEWASQLRVHQDALLAAIILHTETGLSAHETELHMVVHSLFNNGLRAGGASADIWDYAVGTTKKTGIQGRGAEFRRYGSSKIPQGKRLREALDIVHDVLHHRADTGDSFSQVTNFVHTVSQRNAHIRDTKALPEKMAAWEKEMEAWEAGGKRGRRPSEPRVTKSPEQVDAKWSQKMHRIKHPDLPKERIQVYGTQSRRLEPESVRRQAEIRIQEVRAQENPVVGRTVSKIADTMKIDLARAAQIAAANLGAPPEAVPEQPVLMTEPIMSEGQALPPPNMSDAGYEQFRSLEPEKERVLYNSNEEREAAEALARLGQEGWTLLVNDITNKAVLVNQVSLGVPAGTRYAIPTSINVGFGTNLAMIPLEGHRFPTVQYIGGQHTAASVTFRCEGLEGRRFLSQLKSLVNSDEENAIHFREFAKRKGIQIRNPLLNSVGLTSVFLEDLSVDTIPGSPEGVNVTMRLVDASLAESMPPILVGKGEVDIDDILNEALGYILTNKWLTFSTGGNFQVNSAEELDPGSTRIGAGNRSGAEARLQTQIQKHLRQYGPEGLLENSREALRLLRDGKELSTGATKEAFAIIEGLKGKNLVDAGRLFITASKISVVPSKEGVASFTPRDLKRLSEILEEALDRRDYTRIDVTDLFKKGVIGKLNAEIPWAGYEGYKGVRINSTATAPSLAMKGLLGDQEHPGAIHKPSFRAPLMLIIGRMISILGVSVDGKQPLDRNFANLAAKMGDMLEVDPGHVAYPDLALPPNPITGLAADTLPDFFLHNESDVKLSNSNLGRVIFGADTAFMPKARGLKFGLAAIENSVQGIKDVYGVGDSDAEIRPAHEGQDGIYMDINRGQHDTVVKKKSVIGHGSIPQRRRAPEMNGALVSGQPEGTVVVGSDINGRHTTSQTLNENKKYNREKSLRFHLQNSVHRSDYDGAQAENLNRISHVFAAAEYDKLFKEFETNYSSEHYAVRRSFPTFKLLFIEENNDLSSPDDPLLAKLTKTYALDDFYGVNAVKEIRIVKAKDMATDVCVIQLLDLDGVLYNRKYLPPGEDFGLRMTRNQADRNPFLDTIIKEGMKVVVKFGYSNDPTALETVFVGQIVNWGGHHMIEIVCQSYGSELVAQKFGADPSENADFWNVTTADLLHDLLDREEVRHFGRWKLGDVVLTGALLGVEKLRPDGKVKKVWTWKPSVVDDNLYIPDLETYASGWAQAWGDLEYVFFDTTIWDCFKEMELRHPGYVAYPVPYGNGADARMTMFFGHPSMPYLARPAQNTEEIEAEILGNSANTLKMRNLITRVGQEVSGWTFRGADAANRLQEYDREAEPMEPIAEGVQAQYASGLQTILNHAAANKLDILANSLSVDVESLRLALPSARAKFEKLHQLAKDSNRGQELRKWQSYNNIAPDKFWLATQIFQEGRIRPFRNYELVTSMHDIISNNIRTDHRGTFNSIELRYSDNDVDFANFAEGDVETLTVNADDNIKKHHIRRNIENWPNCSTGDLARRYASQLLANSLKSTYKGELFMMGRPKLKPYDIIWLYDNYSDMAGPIEVQEVVHTLCSETGFTTEVVPHMIVTVKEEVSTIMTDAIGAFFTEHLKEFTTGAIMGASAAATLGLAVPLASSLAVGSASATGTVTALSAVGVTAGLSAPMMASDMASREFNARAAGVSADPDDRPGTIAGLAVGAGAGLAWAVNPIIPCAAGIVAGALLYKILKYNSTREPIIVTPLIKQGKPYVTGLEGMESDGLVVTDLLGGDKQDAAIETFIKRRWRYFGQGIEDASRIVEIGWANWMAST